MLIYARRRKLWPIVKVLRYYVHMYVTMVGVFSDETLAAFDWKSKALVMDVD